MDSLRIQEISTRNLKKIIEVSDQDLKEKWSEYIHWFVWATILFQIILTIFVGRKVLNFEGYDYFLYIVIGENFLQIVGMGYIVANHLFPNNNRHVG